MSRGTARSTKVRAASLWLHDNVCMSMAAGNCEGRQRDEHSRRFRSRAETLADSESLEAVATLVHSETCSMWIQQSHGAYYVDMAVRCCGPDGRAHISHLMKQTYVLDLAKALDIDTNPTKENNP